MNKKKKWKTLKHNGIIFPPEYKSRGIGIKIRAKPVKLTLTQEEMAYQWAKKKDTPYVQDRVFQDNFTEDFAKALGPDYKGLSYADIDFTEAYAVVDREKALRETMTKEERKAQAAARKKEREKLKKKYGVAIVDGKEVEVGNYMAEPPGIFVGRGAHPLRGRWKPRITAQDVTLNMSRNSPVPKGGWKSIDANHSATWLASWTDFLTKKAKYVWLADTADIKQNMDKAKYVKAEALAADIDKVLDRMAVDMDNSEDPEMRKISTVCYLIYRTAMRVGDEKDPDEADTVGATTLRKEHVKITEDSVEFDFLGKDSIRWQETIKATGPHDKKFLRNLAEIVQDKRGPKDEIFDGISSRKVNAYYSKIVSYLTAKVFRTYSATAAVKRYLAGHSDIRNASQDYKIYHAKRANLEAAVMCNHKRTIPKNFKESLQKRSARLKEEKAKKPWEGAEDNLKKAKESKPRTKLQKQRRRERIKRCREQVKSKKARHAAKIEKMSRQIKLIEQTKDYNLGTSLRNYIDPRVVKAWADKTRTEWKKLYTATLQRKFLWVEKENLRWSEIIGRDGNAGADAITSTT